MKFTWRSRAGKKLKGKTPVYLDLHDTATHMHNFMMNAQDTGKGELCLL